MRDCNYKRIFFPLVLILIIVFTCVSVYSQEGIKENIVEINVDEINQSNVSEEGTILIFKPERDGLYSFEWEIEQNKSGDSDLISYHNIILEILDKNNTLLNTNAGSKYDVYENSYNSGENIAIGEGGDSDDSPWYYKSTKQNCYAGQTYYIRLGIPGEELISKENVQELIDDGAVVVEIDQNGQVVEKTDYDLEVTRNVKVLVSYQSVISDAEKDDNGGGGFFGMFLGILLLIIVLMIILKRRKRKKKNNRMNDNNSISLNQRQKTTNEAYSNKSQSLKQDTQNNMYKCRSCGKIISKDVLFCKYCGEKNELPIKNNDSKFCSNCGDMLKSNTKFCSKCGNKIK